MKGIPPVPFGARFVIGAVVLSGFALVAFFPGCGSSGTYERLSGNGDDLGGGGGALGGGTGEAGQGGISPGTGGGTGGVAMGSGGTIAETGGMGGHSSSGGGGAGGAGAGTGGGAGVPVESSGGAGGQTMSSGGSGGTGGAVATGGVGTGGIVATGGTGNLGGASPSGGGGGGGNRGAGGGGTSQKILSIDFVGGVVSNGGAGGQTIAHVPMGPTEVAGVKPGANWNAALGSSSVAALTPLTLADGSSLAASLTWSAPGAAGTSGVYSVGFPDAPGDVRMMNGYLDPVPASGTTPTVTVTVSGLASLTGGYDVYVYSFGYIDNTDTRTRKLAIGNANSTLSEKGPSATTFGGYVLGTNYVVFKQVAGASFTLTATAVTGLTKRVPVNGLQIVWPSGS